VEQRNSYQPFLPVTMRLKAGTVFITFPALSAVLTLTAVVCVVAVSTLPRLANLNCTLARDFFLIYIWCQ
ncbi:MAG: hypothetical protein LBL04_06900, partial [Bacteroidales bacterium]|nr:hypothetical protein [Bacteroidales bacterium]